MPSVRVLIGGVLLVGAFGCESEQSPGGGDPGDGFALDYHSGAEALVELDVSADLSFSGTAPGVPSTLPSVGVAQARAMLAGNGQQSIELVLSSGSAPYEGDTFRVYLEFSRANDGGTLDGGGALTMGCDLGWTGPDYDFAVSGDCSVRQTGGGYALTIVETYDEETTITGTLSFSPVSNQTYAFTPGSGCPSDQTCLSLDSSDYAAETGYCLPSTNLKSAAAPCSADCPAQLTLESGGAEICVCSAPCGNLPVGGGGDPPVCDPAYGCIDY